MSNLIKLFRVKHYLKNALIFFPLFFSKSILDDGYLMDVVFGFISFSLLSSVVYIFNDIQDVEKDRMHPKKKNRPIASGKISVNKAYSLATISFFMSILFSIITKNYLSLVYIFIYLVLNLAYSLGLKNKPIIDIAILSSGFILRLMYGAALSHVLISNWLYLTVITGSLYLGMGKRRNELDKVDETGTTRAVLKYYNIDFLDKNMTTFMALTITFYSLWAVQFANHTMIWTVPIVILIFMKYSLNIETDSDGDPVEVVLHDKYLYLLVMVYVCVLTFAMYL